MNHKARIAKLEKQTQPQPTTDPEAMRAEIITKLDDITARYEAGELDTGQPVNLSPVAQEIIRRLDAIAEVQHEQANK